MTERQRWLAEVLDDRPHHLTVWRDESEERVYVDGVLLSESGAATLEGTPVVGDIQRLAEAAVRPDGTAAIRIIQPGWGSSGYYPADVLERDGPRVFTAGLKMFWDHPTVAEEMERPERSLRDLAGELVSDARWVGEHPEGAGLYAEVKVFEPFRSHLPELAEHIGVSIRALGTSVPGEAEGRQGAIIDRLLAARSVDFVTEPGAGGRILQVFEAARPPEPTAQQEAHDCSAEETRELLRATLRARSEGENRYIWVADFGDDWVVYEDDGSGSPDPGYFRAAYEISDDGAVTVGAGVKVARHTEWRPVTTGQTESADVDAETERQRRLDEARNCASWFESRIHRDFTVTADGLFGDGHLTRDERIALSHGIGAALDAFRAAVEENAPQLYQRDPFAEPTSDTGAEGADTVTENEQHTKEASVPEPTPAELQSLQEAIDKAVESRMAATVAEADQRAARAEEALLLRDARDIVVTEVAKVQNLPELTRTRVVESLVKVTPPLKEDRTLDKDALVAKVAEAVKAEVEYLTKVGGGSQSFDLGGGTPPADTAAWESDIASRFQRLGLSESAAKTAAAGRSN